MFNIREETYRFFDKESGCILHLPQEWEVELQNIPLGEFASKGDSKWETGLFYFTYKDPELLRGILNCYEKVKTENGYYYQGYRFPGFGSDDDSRDQNILALSSLYHNGQTEHLTEIASHLRYRLSKRFRMQTMWFWVKYLAGKKWAGNVFGILQLLETFWAYGLNKLLRRLTGCHESFTQEECSTEEHIEKYNWNQTNKKNIFNKAFWMRAQPMPPFAVHLSAWMISCLQDGWIKRLNEKLIRWEAEDSNYMVRLLTRDNTVTQEQIESWLPAIDFRWQERLNIQKYVVFLGTDPPRPKFRLRDGTYRYSNKNDILFNTVDKDILFVLKKKLDETQTKNN